MAATGFHILPKPFLVIVAALDESLESVDANCIEFGFDRDPREGRVIYTLKDTQFGNLATWTVQMQDHNVTELHVGVIKYPQPNLSEPNWQSKMAALRAEMTNAYDFVSAAIIDHFNRTLARGVPPRNNEDSKSHSVKDDFVDKVYWVDGKSIKHMGKIVGIVREDGSLEFNVGRIILWERSGTLITADGYKIEQFLKDSAERKSLFNKAQKKLQEERDEQGKTLYVSTCTDTSALWDTVEGFLHTYAPKIWEPDEWTPRIHSGRLESRGGTPSQYIIYASTSTQMGTSGWMIGQVEYSSFGDDKFSFSLYRYPNDAIDLDFDYQHQKDLLNDLARHLRMAYPNGISEDRIVLDKKLPLSPKVLFDSVLQAAKDWQFGTAWCSVSPQSDALPWTPAEWMGNHDGEAVIKVTEYSIIRREDGNAIGLITIQPRLDGTTRLLVEQKIFKYERYRPLVNEGNWSIDVTTELGFIPELFFAELSSRIMLRLGENPQSTSQLGEGHLSKDTKSKRERGVSPEVLEDCHRAMKAWLDGGKSLSTAAELAGRDDQTVLKHIPKVLGLADETTRQKWVSQIQALGKGKYLGEFGREDKRS